MTKSTTPKNIVLYADDDQDDLELLQESFAKYSNHVEVVTFTDGVTALSYLQRLVNSDVKPCLIILDINMPLLSGKDVLVRLKELDHLDSVPVVLFSTSSQPQDKLFAERHGAGFLTKPLETKQMEMITDQFIDHCAEDIRRNIRKQIQ